MDRDVLLDDDINTFILMDKDDDNSKCYIFGICITTMQYSEVKQIIDEFKANNKKTWTYPMIANALIENGCEIREIENLERLYI